MRTKLIQVNNAKAVCLSEELITEFNLNDEVILQPTSDGILIRAHKTAREGWAQQFKAAEAEAASPNELADFTNKFDDEEWTW